MIEVAHSMSRVRFPAGTGGAKGLRAEEGRLHSRGRLSGTQGEYPADCRESGALSCRLLTEVCARHDAVMTPFFIL